MVVAILAAGALTACGPGAQDVLARPAVVATLPPIADWCRVLLETDATAHALLQPGQTPHGYEPTPQDARRITDARALVAWGGGIDDWAANLVTAAHAATPVSWLYRSPKASASGVHAHGHAHDEGENPHAWLDPVDARARVDHLAAVLAEVFPEHAQQIRIRATAYDGALAELENRAHRARTIWTDARIVTLHDAWPHFFGACGLRSLGSIQAASGAPPSSRHLAALIEALKANQRAAVIAEPQVSPTLAQAVAREAGVPLLVLDPLGREGVAGYDSYLHMMHSNLDTLANSFGAIPE